MYTLTGVTKSFHKGNQTVAALQGVDLVIDDGEWLAIQGRTGHGKSTLLNMLGGLGRPTTGTVELDGHNLTTMPENEITRVRATLIGFIFQTFNLIPTLTAAENVEAALVPLGISTAERRERVIQALDSVGLADRTRHLPSELSGGQQQRVGIARALAKQPKVLLADEPTGNLDEESRDELISLLDALWRDHKLTVVLVTHDTALAYRAPRVGIMRNGRLSIRQDTRPTTPQTSPRLRPEVNTRATRPRSTPRPSRQPRTGMAWGSWSLQRAEADGQSAYARPCRVETRLVPAGLAVLSCPTRRCCPREMTGLRWWPGSSAPWGIRRGCDCWSSCFPASTR
jgi:putative ABC transport system ATP-binding protein